MSLADDLARFEQEALGFAAMARNAAARLVLIPTMRAVTDQVEDAKRRRKLFSDHVGDPSWEIMLDLFGAEGMGRDISVSSACLASGAPVSTALRHLVKLTEAGLVERRADSRDRRRVHVKLSKTGRAKMEAYFSDVVA